ncbi:adenosylcobinamide-GDP ribazoletransferase [Tepidamorphus sp. 3E244]|uniref:adenosylcobinamide-GDP ribazoletransferase n=1 Tax=Tepidamorphus sp. 3E244 TaxID=3385498 RepID=UPI0038FCD88F
MRNKSDDRPDPLDFSEFGPEATWRRGLNDIAAALRFYTRLPLFGRRAENHGAPDFARMAWATPIAGAVVGVIGACIFAFCVWANLSPIVAAGVSLAAMIVTTGAFHEDGLADTADSLGAYTVQDRLEVMRDSRIGTFGACALILSLLLRAGLLASIFEAHGLLAACLVLIAAETTSRAGSLAMGYSLPPARSEGAAISAGKPTGDGFFHAALVAGLVTALCVATTIGFGTGLAAFAAVYLAAFLMVRFAARMYRGQTGDAAGATQQVATLAFLAAVAMLR